MKGVSYVIGSILMLIIVIALAGMAYMYIAGVFTGTIQGIEIVDSFCEGGEVTMIIRNIGTTPITSLDIKQTSPTDDLTTLPPTLFLQEAIDPGKTISYKDVCEGLTGRSCIYRIVPPIGKAATASAFCTTRPTSLVLSLHFDEGFGTTVTDKSGNGNDGTLYNGPTWVDGKIEKALDFDGLNDHVGILSKPELKYTGGDMTISVWINTHTSETTWGRIISKPWNGWGRYNYELSWTSDNRINVRLTGGDGSTDQTYTLTTTETVSKGEWHHITVVLLGSPKFVKIYIDGRLSEEGTHGITQWAPVYGDTDVQLSIGTLYPYGVWDGYYGGSPAYDFSYDGTID
ncbi:MAG: LamG-like jellyroll fold domain-containing protein [Methanosarcinales archaeon]